MPGDSWEPGPEWVDPPEDWPTQDEAFATPEGTARARGPGFAAPARPLPGREEPWDVGRQPWDVGGQPWDVGRQPRDQPVPAGGDGVAPDAGLPSPRAAAGDAGRGSGRAILAILVVGAVLAGWWWWQGRPRPVAEAPAMLAAGRPVTGLTVTPAATPAPGTAPAGVAPPGVAASAPAGDPTAGAPPTAMLVVHVVGTVRRPGVVRLPAGSRVIDAVTAAGGVRPGMPLGPVNLARPLVDGEQVVVGPKATEQPPVRPEGGEPTASPGGAAGDTRVNLNTATQAELEELPRVGPVLAQRIIAWREEHGGFRAIEELGEVSGIGAATFAGLAPLVTI